MVWCDTGRRAGTSPAPTESYGGAAEAPLVDQGELSKIRRFLTEGIRTMFPRNYYWRATARVAPTTSSRISYRSRLRLSFTSSLVLSQRDPLRWARVGAQLVRCRARRPRRAGQGVRCGSRADDIRPYGILGGTQHNIGRDGVGTVPYRRCEEQQHRRRGEHCSPAAGAVQYRLERGLPRRPYGLLAMTRRSVALRLLTTLL